MKRTPDSTREFFDEMSRTYDRDLVYLGWSPLRVCQDWPFEVSEGQSTLDAGCGTGALAEHWAKQGAKVSAFDLSERMVRRAKMRLRAYDAAVQTGDLSGSWPVEDATIDRAACFGAMEFVPDIAAALLELARVLASGGRALVSFEDLYDEAGIERAREEMRYDEFPLWRRSLEEIKAAMPESLSLERAEKVRAYRVDDQGFVASYWVVELARV